MKEVTQLIHALQEGHAQAAEVLLPLVYEELRRLAHGQMAGERPGQTLQATALVHEAYLKMIQDPDRTWENRRHFFRTAAEAMRRILIDQARRKRARKHGGNQERTDIDPIDLPMTLPEDRLLDLNDALDRLATQYPEKAELVKLRFFAGLNIEETARTLEISVPTANRWWAYARVWMYRCMQEDKHLSQSAP